MAGSALITTFERLVEEARAEGLRQASGAHRAVRASARGPEPQLHLGRDDADYALQSWPRLGASASVALHAAAAVAIVVLPLLLGQPLPDVMGGTRAFFVEPIAAPPPPPPPPPPAPRAAAAARVAPRNVTPPAGFVAPIEVPTEIKPEEGLDFGVEGGVPGGVEGGVPGGVVGGVVGGLPDAPPPAPVRPVRVGGDVREPQKLVDVAPVYPELARKAGVEGIVVLEATIDPRGRVADVKVVSSIPVFDEAALEAVRKWVYTPTLLNGVPTPIIMTVTVRFRLHRGGS